MSVLHLLHGWSDRDETTGQLRRRSTVPHHSAIVQPSSAPVNVARGQRLPPSTHPPSPSSTSLHLLRPPSSTRSSSTPLVSQDYSLGLLTWITYMDYIYTTDYSTTADYSRSRTTNYNIICHCLTCPWPCSFYELFYLS